MSGPPVHYDCRDCECSPCVCRRDWPPDLEPDDRLGPTLSGPRGYMSEATHLTRRVLLLERAIRDAKAELDRSPQWGEHEARAYRILNALPIPER